MAVVVSIADLKLGETACRFEGRDHGSPVAFFITDHPPGGRVPLHRHPYTETFIVQEGLADFTVDGETIAAHAGQIVIVPAGAAHGFANVGDGSLRQVSIHPSDHVIQEMLEK